jgi:hypothetical protein
LRCFARLHDISALAKATTSNFHLATAGGVACLQYKPGAAAKNCRASSSHKNFTKDGGPGAVSVASGTSSGKNQSFGRPAIEVVAKPH